jgi:hypothetical protein
VITSSAEQLRVDAEQTRQESEASRQAHEQARHSAEQARIEAEETRAAADAARTAAMEAMRDVGRSLTETLEQMKVVEEMRRAYCEFLNKKAHLHPE